MKISAEYAGITKEIDVKAGEYFNIDFNGHCLVECYFDGKSFTPTRAIDGRGNTYVVNSPDDLQDILTDILADEDPNYTVDVSSELMIKKIKD
ncbi:hypothetical protein KDD93_07645 [Campylobacter sp. faydin G-24]|uniref:Uncharacterized protein n=1 Tax=Campylobacter anatolicus TaxID=2829105 RepID=A0ABS5HJM3_9BACT|nr:hypothetical protein [Campylobacter anatolicus]MBR8464436.1 hypothetical protein [Campylobacter anatolicus]